MMANRLSREPTRPAQFQALHSAVPCLGVGSRTSSGPAVTFGCIKGPNTRPHLQVRHHEENPLHTGKRPYELEGEPRHPGSRSLNTPDLPCGLGRMLTDQRPARKARLRISLSGTRSLRAGRTAIIGQRGSAALQARTSTAEDHRRAWKRCRTGGIDRARPNGSSRPAAPQEPSDGNKVSETVRSAGYASASAIAGYFRISTAAGPRLNSASTILNPGTKSVRR